MALLLRLLAGTVVGSFGKADMMSGVFVVVGCEMRGAVSR